MSNDRVEEINWDKHWLAFCEDNFYPYDVKCNSESEVYTITHDFESWCKRNVISYDDVLCSPEDWIFLASGYNHNYEDEIRKYYGRDSMIRHIYYVMCPRTYWLQFLTPVCCDAFGFDFFATKSMSRKYPVIQRDGQYQYQRLKSRIEYAIYGLGTWLLFKRNALKHTVMASPPSPITSTKFEFWKSPEWQEKRRAVFQRDGYQCRKCGSGMNLRCHHTNNANYRDASLDDLETLCNSCHQNVHYYDNKRKSS